MVSRQYLTIDDFDYRDKVVILRVDINSPVDPKTKKIVDETRIDRSLPTIKQLVKKNAKLVIIAHQGDTLDYQNLISLSEHAARLSEKLEMTVQFIDDIAGPAARDKIKGLKSGEVLLLDNLRYLTEEVSTFENFVKLTPEEMTRTYLIRNLAPLADYYVNDAFAAAHRNSPSMVAFQEVLPSAAGVLYDEEVKALTKILENPPRPAIFLLGGAKVSDSFSIMENVLAKGSADYVLATGVTGLIVLMASGKNPGGNTEKYVNERGIANYIEVARECLRKYASKILVPIDFAIEREGARREITADTFPVAEQIIDIGPQTVAKYKPLIEGAETIFVNKPAGMYEKPTGAYGTEALWKIVSKAKGYSVIGGGDTIASAARFGAEVGYVCTGGGAFIRFVAGIEMPLMKAMRKARRRWGK